MTLVLAGDVGTILTSEDALTWSVKASGVLGTRSDGYAVDALYIEYSPDLDLFVAMGNASTTDGRIAVSDDLETWTLLQPLPHAVYQAHWCAGLGLFVAGGGPERGDTIVSADGAAWVPGGRMWQQLAPGASFYPLGARLFWSEVHQRLFATSGENGQASPAIVSYSDDGLTWTQLPDTAIDKTHARGGYWSNYNGGVAAAPDGTLVLVAGPGNGLLRSVDGGVTWTSTTHSISGDTGSAEHIIWADDHAKFVAPGNYRTLSSPDGLAWTENREVSSLNNLVWSSTLQLFCTLRASFGNYVSYRTDLLPYWEAASWSAAGPLPVETSWLIETVPPPPLTGGLRATARAFVG